MLVHNDNNNEHKNSMDVFREIIADYIIGNIDADELKNFCNTIDSIVDEKEIDEQDKGGIFGMKKRVLAIFIVIHRTY